MKQFTPLMIIGVVVTMLSICRAQEVSIFGGRAQLPIPAPDGGGEGGGGEGGDSGGGEGDGEVQDEGQLASALGIDRQALYEDLMRIQEELGGSPLTEQNSQESDDY